MTTDLDARRRYDIDTLNRRYVACPVCDEVWARPSLSPGEIYRCGRCHSVILENKPRGAERTIALMLANLILFCVAVSFPFMRMERSGLSNEISVIDAVGVLAASGMEGLALVCGLFIFLFPLARMLLLLFLALEIQTRRTTGRAHALFLRVAQSIEPWTMAEIFMIGVIVSLVKVGKLADIYLGPAFWAMSALIVFLAMSASAVCRDTIWHDIRRTS
ncbi:MAG: paraquat-inducible protein A [Pseudomonadota bacterium]